MSNAELFDRDETSYERWLHVNPEGFVVNTFRRPAARYFVLHRATCHSISKHKPHTDAAAFTGGRYIKICAHSPEDLLVWARSNGIEEFSSYCTACKSIESQLRN